MKFYVVIWMVSIDERSGFFISNEIIANNKGEVFATSDQSRFRPVSNFRFQENILLLITTAVNTKTRNIRLAHTQQRTQGHAIQTACIVVSLFYGPVDSADCGCSSACLGASIKPPALEYDLGNCPVYKLMAGLELLGVNGLHFVLRIRYTLTITVQVFALTNQLLQTKASPIPRFLADFSTHFCSVFTCSV